MKNRLTVPGLSGLLIGTAMAVVAAPFAEFEPLVMDAASAVAAMEERRDALIAESDAIFSKGEEENRDLDDDETSEVEKIANDVEKLERQIKARKAMLTAAGGGGTPPRRAAPERIDDTRERGNPGAQRRTIEPRPRNDDGKYGFENFGIFAQCVKGAGGASPDVTSINRLQNALTTYANESVGADGGYLVPPEFRREIAMKVMGEESLLSRTDRIVTSSNAVVLPTDETTPYGGSGVQAYWEGEGGLKTQSKPLFGQNQLRLNKLIALVPVTDEMLEDAPQIDSYLRRKVPDVFTAKINTAIIAGTGVGQPLGFMNSPGLITISKVTSQPADTIYFANIVAMYSRMRASSIGRAVWLINQSILPQLFMMSFDPDATAGKIPIYLPGGMAANAPFGTLLGRPIVPIEGMANLGDVGDIAFADLTQYLTATKGGDIRTDVSMHLFFDYDITAFRFVFRVTGQPWWNAPVTPQASGAPTLGHFITLEARG